MAHSTTQTRLMAQQLASVAELAIVLYNSLQDALKRNADLSIVWDGAQDYVDVVGVGEDGEGNIVGCQYTPDEIDNIVFSLDQMKNLFEQQAVTTGDHLGNFNKVAKPAVRRVSVSS